MAFLLLHICHASPPSVNQLLGVVHHHAIVTLRAVAPLHSIPMSTSGPTFRVLPGLPGEGAPPVQFSATGQGTHREGFVVEFSPTDAESWVGNFQPGLRAYSEAMLHPSGRSVLVISGGQLYQVDPDTRGLLSTFGGIISDCIKDPSGSLLVFSDGIRSWALDSSGLRWQTERISWDGIRALSISRGSVTGEAYDPIKNAWTPFQVDLASGRISGGSYPEYSILPKT